MICDVGHRSVAQRAQRRRALWPVRYLSLIVFAWEEESRPLPSDSVLDLRRRKGTEGTKKIGNKDIGEARVRKDMMIARVCGQAVARVEVSCQAGRYIVHQLLSCLSSVRPGLGITFAILEYPCWRFTDKVGRAVDHRCG